MGRTVVKTDALNPEGPMESEVRPNGNLSPAHSKALQTCDELGKAVDAGSIGAIVASHQKLIRLYYHDVLDQANQSFASARRVAWVGFIVLIVTRYRRFLLSSV
jgi:hypothetical protein